MMARPKIVYFIALTLAAVVLSLPIQSALLYHNTAREIPDILGKLSLMNWIMGAILLVTAVEVWRVSSLVKYLAPLSILAVGWNNYLTGAHMLDYSMDQALLGAGLFAGLFSPLMKKDIRNLMNNPNMRWWVRSPRQNRILPITVNPYIGSTWQSRTYDLSETGAFIAFDKQNFEALPKIGEQIKLNLTINTLKKIRFEAVVVRVEEPKGIYPRGIGVKFINLKGDSKKHLANYLEH